MQSLQGEFDGDNLKVAIVSTRWNDDIVDRLNDGAIDVLTDCGVDESDITLVKVPGSYELPLAADRLAGSGDYDGIVAVGAVIRGETPHFDYVAGECARGLSATALEHGLPVGFGVITADTVAQAEDRSRQDEDHNKGAEAANAVIEMISLLSQIDEDD